jgi:hypothetical protein
VLLPKETFEQKESYFSKWLIKRDGMAQLANMLSFILGFKGLK